MNNNDSRRGFLKSLQKGLFQTYNKASAILGSPALAGNTVNLLLKERGKINQGNRDRGFRKPMGAIRYDPKLDKSNIKNKPVAHMVSQKITNKGYTIKLGQKPKKINKNPPKLKGKKKKP